MVENEAVVFEGLKSVVVEERPTPTPGPNEVLIETKRTLVSTGTELAVLTGDHRQGELPLVHGYCNVGEVVDAGSAVDEALIGARVASSGAHQRYDVVRADGCLPIPDPVGDDEAVFTTIAKVAMNGVRRGRLEWGETAVVYGLGLVGQMTLRLCNLAGTETVVGFDVAQSRLSFLPDDPGVRGSNPDEASPVETVSELTDGRLADVVFEVTANTDAIPEEFSVLMDQGRFVLLSSPRETGTFDYYDDCHRPSYEIIGAHASSHPSSPTAGNPWTARRHGELFLELLEQGRIAVEPLVSHVRNFRDAPMLYEMLLRDRTRAMGVVLEWS